MALSSKEKFELNKTVKELEKYRGRHTELVSVYIPSGYEMVKIINHLSQEAGTASNIKSTSTRQNVEDALERMIQHLRLFKMTPPRGLAVFSGNVSEKEGGSDVRVWSIEPPVKLNIRLYRCDKTFVLEPLRDMMDVKEIYGLVIMDNRESDVAYLKGKTIIPISKETSNVPGKTKAGGQSALRYDHLREGAIKDFYQRIAEQIKKAFFQVEGLKGIIVGGPGPAKYNLIENHNYVITELKNKIIGFKDISYTGSYGMQELVEKSEDILANEAVTQEKQIMNKFFGLLNKDPDHVSYGEGHVRDCLERGAVDTLLISEELEDAKIEEYEKLGEQFSTKVEIISVETMEGKQLRDIGKFAAILRYKLNY
jgi:peptide chain release factor subunit 1